MIKKFLGSTFIYAGSAFLFSISRQLIFFPLLMRKDNDLFKEISFLLLLIDFMVYFFGSSLADFYVRSVTKEDKKKGLFKFIFSLSILSLLTVIAFFSYNFSWSLCIGLAIYMVLFSANTIQLKVYFNNLLFVKNYTYVFIRLIPYFLTILITYFSPVQIHYFIVCLLLCEFISFAILFNGLKKINFEFISDGIQKDYSVIKFIVIYVLFALIQRMDMFIVEHFYNYNYVIYYQMISILLIGVNPVILLTSSSLLSILTHMETGKVLANKLKVVISIIGVALVSSIVFYFVSPYILAYLYPENTILSKHPYFSIIVIFFTLVFFISRTFIIKYTSLKTIVIINILTIIIPLFFIQNFVGFITSFFIIRGLIYLYALLKIDQ